MKLQYCVNRTGAVPPEKLALTGLEVQKAARAFHSTIPGYEPTPLTALDHMARRVEELGAGLRLRRASPEAIRAAVRQVREQQSYRSRAREIAAGFRDAGGYRRGADKILEAAARGGGACAENPPML